jgi:hypothetical protein
MAELWLGAELLARSLNAAAQASNGSVRYQMNSNHGVASPVFLTLTHRVIFRDL